MAKVIVTGGSGFVGSHLVSHLSSIGHEVTNIDMVPSDFPNTILQDLTVGYPELEADFCFHLASATGGINFNQRNEVLDYNERLNSNVNKMCNKIPTLFISTLNVYEGCQSIYGRLSPTSPYAISKFQGEKVFLASGHSVLRIPNMFGKSQIDKFSSYGESHVIPDIIHKIRNSDSFVDVWGDGNQKRNFLHVTDLCKYLEMHISHVLPRIISVGSEITISISDLVIELMEYVGKKLDIKYSPEYMKFEFMFVEKFVHQLRKISTIKTISEGLKL